MITKEQFVQSSQIIIQTLKLFIQKITEIEQQHVMGNALSSELSPAFLDLERDLTTPSAMENARIYHFRIYGTVVAVLQYKQKIEERYKGQTSIFWNAIKKELVTLDRIFWERPVFSKEIENPVMYLHHRIWFGSFLPERYQQYLLNFKKHNPHFKIKLWTDYETISAEDYKNFEIFCSENNIALKNIRENKALINYDLITEELDSSKIDTKFSKIHYVRAADLSRVAILIAEGGLYTDTDTDTIDELCDIDMPLGFLINKAKRGKPVNNNRLTYTSVGYDFMASFPNNEIMLLAAKISQLDYSSYHLNKDVRWRGSKQHQVHWFSTVTLSGSSVLYALDFLIANNQVPADKIDSLFVDISPFCISFFDKSWLSDLQVINDEAVEYSEEELESEQQSLQNFIKEVMRTREEHFPANSINPIANNLEQFGIFTQARAQSKKNASETSCINNALEIFKLL